MAKYFKIIFLLIFIPTFSSAQYHNIKFEHISVEQGLSQSPVNCILQDSHGFMWFGTVLGLKKFDGYKFINYKHEPHKPESISGNNVTSIIEDKSGYLWLTAKDGGFDRFDRESEIFVHFRINENDSLQNETINIVIAREDHSGNLWLLTTNNELYYFDTELESSKRYFHDFLSNMGASSNYISQLYADRRGILWIGTSRKGLFRFDPKNEIFKQYKYDPAEKGSLSNNSIISITEDKSGNIYIGTYNGLNKFDKQKNRFTRYFYESERAKRGSKSLIRVLSSTQAGLIWIVTGEGLVLFNPETEGHVNLYQNSESNTNVKNETLVSIYEDRSGIIWGGTFSGELFKYDPNKIKFIHYINSPNDPHSLSHDHILDICEDSQGTLWVGTWGGGLNELKANQANKLSPKWINHKHDPLNSQSIGGNSVYHIYEDSKKTLWFNTSNGLFRLVRPSIKSTNINNQKNRHTFIRESKISGYMYEDKQNNFWIGTGRGLYKFDRLTKSFTHYAGDPNNPESLGENEITSILQTRGGQMWIGTKRMGLYKFDPETENFIRNFHNPENLNSLSSNEIHMIYEDRSGFLWITTNKGLNKLDLETDDFTHFNSNVGLPGDATFVILADSKDNLWISSGRGLFRFSPESEVVISFDKEDGLRSIDLNLWGHRSRSGWMYFSSVYGLIAFHPDSIKFNNHIPKIVLTDLQIYNKSILPGEESPLKKSISETKEINLVYNQSVFSFEFAALDYHNQQKNLYAYKMESVDPDWVFTDASRRFATYTNLDPGEYTFRVKGSNNDGVWNEEGTSLKVIITPPWWKTNLAYTFYIFLVGFFVFSIWRFQTNRLKIKHELKLEHMHAEKLEEADQFKSRFFANVSHEFRTPLTLILGPVEQMFSGEYKGNYKEQYKVIIRNARRLLQLINQLLDLSKLESGKLKLHAEATEIVRLTNGLVQVFESSAERKSIILKFQSEIELQEVYIDVEKFETIIHNLLSNAFKFTPEGGEIGMTVKIPNIKHQITNKSQIPNPKFPVPDSDFVEIIISNTGPGIPADKIDKIFDRFYQIDDSYTKDEEGTGIGLALTKELVELHHGEIRVESEQDTKTTFTVLLPLGKDHLKEDEIATITQDYSPSEIGASGLSEFAEEITKAEGRKKTFESEISKQENQPIILIVDDNADLRQYIRSNMDNQYRILEAENGEEGLEKATKEIPDLIISDVMMPKMDGFEFCSNIKTDEHTSHIPVILITARAAQEDKIEGLETGADDYITKPFDRKELNVRVKNLIEQRRKLRERFIKDAMLEPSEIAVTSIDKQFLNRALEIIEKEISNPEFDVETFVKTMAVSRTHLYNKLRALAGQSAKEFIRTIRLKRGAQLIRKQAGTISEIAYGVGFLNPAYFSECFRKQFGQSPSQFVSQLKDS